MSLLSLAAGIVVTPRALDPAERDGGGGDGSNYMHDGAPADPGIQLQARFWF